MSISVTQLLSLRLDLMGNHGMSFNTGRRPDSVPKVNSMLQPLTQDLVKANRVEPCDFRSRMHGKTCRLTGQNSKHGI